MGPPTERWGSAGGPVEVLRGDGDFGGVHGDPWKDSFSAPWRSPAGPVWAPGGGRTTPWKPIWDQSNELLQVPTVREGGGGQGKGNG